MTHESIKGYLLDHFHNYLIGEFSIMSGISLAIYNLNTKCSLSFGCKWIMQIYGIESKAIYQKHKQNSLPCLLLAS